MSNYFTSVGVKSSIKSKNVLSPEGSRFDLLLQHYESQPRPIETNLEAIDKMFIEWCESLFFNNNSVLVRGFLSKYRLLETFKTRYLDTGEIANPPMQKAKKNKRATRRITEIQRQEDPTNALKITTVRMHGFTPITLENFIHAVLGITDNRRLKQDDTKNFIRNISKTNTHYVFLLHSFDLLYKDCKKICDLIFEFYKLSPKYIHIIMSVDHLLSAKILGKLKLPLQLAFFHVPYGESFFFERTHSYSVIERGDEGKGNQTLQPFGDQLNFQTLRDVYQALQKACQAVLVFILKTHCQRSKELEDEVDEQPSPKKKQRSSTRGGKLPKRNAGTAPYLDFQKLMKHCEANFILRRTNQLYNHLEELLDHRIIELDDSKKKILCLVSVATCQKFIEFLETNASV